MKFCLLCQHRYEGRSWTCPGCGFEPSQHNGFPVLAPHLLSANEGFNVSRYSQLAATENGHFWFDSRNQLIVWLLAKNFPVMDNMLEIGCGTGCVLANIKHHFPGLRLSGSDIFLEGMAYARQRVKGAELFQMDACNVPFENEFSVIGAFDVLEHIEDDQLALSMIFRALKPGGGGGDFGAATPLALEPSRQNRLSQTAIHKARIDEQNESGRFQDYPGNLFFDIVAAFHVDFKDSQEHTEQAEHDKGHRCQC